MGEPATDSRARRTGSEAFAYLQEIDALCRQGQGMGRMRSRSTWTGITLRVRDRWLIVPQQDVREVLQTLPVTTLPGAAPLLLGYADLRGLLVPVIDLGVLLGAPPVPATRGQRLVLLNTSSSPVAFRVEAKGTTIAFTRAQQQPRSRLDDWVPERWCLGALAIDGATLPVLSLNRAAARLDAPVDAPLGETPVDATPDATAKAGSPDVDPELLAVFIEEAAELLDTLDTALGAWGEGDAPARARRALHTLKGGARMSGLVDMGDLAHQMESAIEAAQSDAPACLPAWQKMADTLRTMLDGLRHTTPSSGRAAVSDMEEGAGEAPWDPALLWRPTDGGSRTGSGPRAVARVAVDVLDHALMETGEIGTQTARMTEYATRQRQGLASLMQAIEAVRMRVRGLLSEADAQISALGQGGAQAGGLRGPQDRYAGRFDPLEMDRYSRIQESARALVEAVDELSAQGTQLERIPVDMRLLLDQQYRAAFDVQQTLMDALLVPFSTQRARLERVVRQTGGDTGKLAVVEIVGADTRMDRNVLEQLVGSLEHLLRNAVVHGIEMPDARQAGGKPVMGRIQVRAYKDAQRAIVEVSDDGRGLDYAAIRRKGEQRHLIEPGREVNEDTLGRLIFEPGFSTAERLTQNAGRGVGLDVVSSTVRRLGGDLRLRARPGQATCFTLSLPLNLVVAKVLLVRVGTRHYTLPISIVTGVARVTAETVSRGLSAPDADPVRYGGLDYPLHYMGEFLGQEWAAPAGSAPLRAVLVRTGIEAGSVAERRFALVVDTLVGVREVVSKSAQSPLAVTPGVHGVTLLPDGTVAVMLDLPVWLRSSSAEPSPAEAVDHGGSSVPVPAVASGSPIPDTVLVADDSLTMRRMAERLLGRNGYSVVTTRDGLEAIEWLGSHVPRCVLLDIEMPRADGFDVAQFIRSDPRLKTVPIVMITSRAGDKHRERAQHIGVDGYLIKPYTSEQLLTMLQGLPSPDGESRT